VITAEQKISKSNFAQDFTSNVIFRLPQGQPTHWLSFSIFEILNLPSQFLCLSKALEESEDSPSAVITAEQKISKSNFAQNITSNVTFRLPEGQPTHWLSFSIFEIFVLPSKFLCLSKALGASKVSPSAVITAEQKISKSNFAQNITSNIIFGLPEGQPTHWLSFSIFEIFVLPSKFLCLGKALKASRVSPSAVITAEQKISKYNFAQNMTSNVTFRLPEGQPTHWLSFSIFEIFVLSSRIFP